MTQTQQPSLIHDCPECGNGYLAIRTDIHKDKREFVYCDICGALASRNLWQKASVVSGYVDGINVQALSKALLKLGCASGGQEEVAAKLSDHINRLIRAVEDLNFQPGSQP